MAGGKDFDFSRRKKKKKSYPVRHTDERCNGLKAQGLIS